MPLAARRPRVLVAALTVALLLVGGLAGVLIGSSSVRAASSPSTVVAVCVNDVDGTMHVIRDATGTPSQSGGACSADEHEVDWNLQGPTGADGAVGPTGATGATGPAGHLDPVTATAATTSLQQVARQAAALQRQLTSDATEQRAVAGHELQLASTLPNGSRFVAQLRTLVGPKAASDLLAAGGRSAVTTRKVPAATTVADLQDQLDSLSELSETESLRLQMAMDRVSKFMQTLSNLEKKTSDTDSAIVQNLQ